VRPVARAIAVAAVASLVAACHASPPADTKTEGAASTATATTPPPVDHLAPDELVEGTDQVFGLTLPRSLGLSYSFVSVVLANGPLTIHPVAKYFRARVEGGTFREGVESATFEHATVPGKPGVELGIQITTTPGGVHVEIRNTTPPPVPNLPDEAARWRRVGLTPTGRILDPTHLD
jgi:hypothetical protein